MKEKKTLNYKKKGIINNKISKVSKGELRELPKNVYQRQISHGVSSILLLAFLSSEVTYRTAFKFTQPQMAYSKFEKRRNPK